MVVTESGYHTATLWGGEHPPVSEAAMGRYVPRLFLDYFNAGFAKSYLYELVDEGASMSSREEAFGLVRADGTPKPAYTSLQNLIAVLSDPGPAFTPGSLSLALTGDTTNVRRLLLQKRNGRFFLVLWHDAYSYTVAGGVHPSAQQQSGDPHAGPARGPDPLIRHADVLRRENRVAEQGVGRVHRAGQPPRTGDLTLSQGPLAPAAFPG